MDFTDAELNMLHSELYDRADNYRHHPDECESPELFDRLYLKVRIECKRRREAGSHTFWWAR